MGSVINCCSCCWTGKDAKITSVRCWRCCLYLILLLGNNCERRLYRIAIRGAGLHLVDAFAKFSLPSTSTYHTTIEINLRIVINRKSYLTKMVAHIAHVN